MHKFRVYRFRGREVIVMEAEPRCWRVRFIEYGRLEHHTALVDPKEIQPTPWTVSRVTADGRLLGRLPE